MIDIVLTLLGFSAIFAAGLIIFGRIFERRIIEVIDSVGDIFSEIVSEPTISKAFGILGKRSGDARGERATVDALATDILAGPQLQALKMGASMLGIDLDEYIEEHGAMNTITGLQQIGGVMGIDIQDILKGGIGKLGDGQPPQSGKSAYL